VEILLDTLAGREEAVMKLEIGGFQLYALTYLDIQIMTKERTSAVITSLSLDALAS
jgi:hypothetical protein